MQNNDNNPYREFFTAIADMLKLPATPGMKAVDAVRTIWGKEKGQKIKKLENQLRREGVHRHLIRDFYNSNNNDSNLRQYTVLVSNQRYSSTIFTSPQRVELRLSLSSVESNCVSNIHDPTYTKRLTKLMKMQSNKVAKKFRHLGVRNWDQDIYRLVGDPFGGDKLRLSFSISRYFSYRFTAGLLEDELFESLIKHKNDVNRILFEHPNTLPIREQLLPNKDSLKHLSERISTGGISCVVAIARGEPYNDFLIPLQVRSQAVAEGRGVFTASIQAWHQPNIGDYQNEVSLYWTVLKEMFEEIYRGEEVIKLSPHLKYNWYLKECPGVAYIHENPEKVTLELLGIGINALMGTYDCAILLVIHDPEYWDTYGNSMELFWETEKWLHLSTKEIMPTLQRAFNDYGWLDQGMFSLSQGLLRLRELDDKRVSYLDIGYELH